jgi:hypothetical protein
MAAQMFFLPFPVAFNSNGMPSAGCKLYFYENETTTPVTTYSDVELTVAHTHPVVAAASGRIPAIYLDDSALYRLRIEDRNGVELYDEDNYRPGSVILPWNSAVLDPMGFGFVEGSSTTTARETNGTAMESLLEYLVENATVISGVAKAPRVQWPAGTFYFDTRDYFDVKAAIHFEGAGTGIQYGGSTRFVFTKGGFRFNRADTLGGVLESPATTGADGWIMRGITGTSEQTRPAAPDYASQATCGVLSYCRGILEDCYFDEFTSDGVRFESATAGGTTTANCNGSRLVSVGSHNAGRHGI